VVDVGGAGVADVGAIPSELCCAIHGVNFFKSNAEHERFGVFYLFTRFEHQFHHFTRHVSTH